MKIDFHSHYYPKTYIKVLESFRASSSSASVYLPPSEELLSDIERRLGVMAKHAVDIQVLSLANPWTDFLPPTEAAKMAREVNDSIAAVTEKYPDRFVGLATLPFKDPETSLEELRRAKRDLGLRGVCTGTRIGEKPFNLDEFGAVFAEAAKLDMPIFLHPTASAAFWELQELGMMPVLGFPLETTVGFVKLIMGGLFDKAPGLKLVAAHLGGALPYLSGRLSVAHEGFHFFNRPAYRVIPGPKPEALRQIYVDSISYSVPALMCAYELLGPDHMLYGTDYPFTFGSPDLIDESLNRMPIGESERTRILYENAQRILKIS